MFHCRLTGSKMIYRKKPEVKTARRALVLRVTKWVAYREDQFESAMPQAPWGMELIRYIDLPKKAMWRPLLQIVCVERLHLRQVTDRNRSCRVQHRVESNRGACDHARQLDAAQTLIIADDGSSRSRIRTDLPRTACLERWRSRKTDRRPQDQGRARWGSFESPRLSS